ncbi:MAG: HAD family hydrolase [Clostridia bacterium]|nr:HAD family hydrolase [Clostridia bacterium]
MSIKAVLFDLDGTLLPMDQDVFIKTYFGLLAKRLAFRGYEPKSLVDAIWQGTAAMVKNDGSKTNEKVFWDSFATIYGEKAREDEPYFEEFYREEFDKVQASCGYTPKAAEVIQAVKDSGLRAVLATNPIFPAIATQKRIAWAGLSPDDFELYTTYENSRHSKPNPAYYLDILEKIHLKPEECLMVGNDVDEDMIAEAVGMKAFLLTDCLINKHQRDISSHPHGGFDALIAFIKEIQV